MSDLTLHRFFYGPDCVLGYYALDDRLVYTIEDPWKFNAVGLSCIPDGTYRCVPCRFNRGGYDAIEITNVPGRTHILFHKANTAEDVTGCIASGSSIGVLGGRLAVLNSAGAFARLMFEFGGREFDLEILPVQPLKGTAP